MGVAKENRAKSGDLSSLLEAKLPEATRSILESARNHGRQVEWMIGPAEDFADLIVPNPHIHNAVTFTDTNNQPFNEFKIVQAANAINIEYLDPNCAKRPGHDKGFVVGDEHESSKLQITEAFDISMGMVSSIGNQWLGLRDLVVVPSKIADGPGGSVIDIVHLMPKAMAWGKMAWDIIHGMPSPERLREDFDPKAIFMSVPGLRPTLFKNTQSTVFDRSADSGVLHVYSATTYQGLGMCKKPVFVVVSRELVEKGKGFLAHATMAVLEGVDKAGRTIRRGLIYHARSGHGKTEFRFIRKGKVRLGESVRVGVADLVVNYPPERIPRLTAAGDDGVVIKDFKSGNGYGVGENMEKGGAFDRPSSSYKPGDLPENDEIFASTKNPYEQLTLSMQAEPGRMIETHHRIEEDGKLHSNPRQNYSWKALANTQALKQDGVQITTDPIKFDISVFGMGVTADSAVISWANRLPLCAAYTLVLAGICRSKSVSVTEGQAQSHNGLTSDKFGTMEGFSINPDVMNANRLWEYFRDLHKVEHWVSPIGWVGPWYKASENEAELALRDALLHTETGDSHWQLAPGKVPFFGLRPKEAFFLGQQLPPEYNDPYLQFDSKTKFIAANRHILEVIDRSLSGIRNDRRLDPEAERAIGKALEAPIFVDDSERAHYIFEDLNTRPGKLR